MPFIKPPKYPVESLGMGVFDGMHRGHQAIANQCDALLTFYPHPDWVLGKNLDLKLLTTPEERRYFFGHSISVRFTKALAAQSAEHFLNHIIETHLSPKRIVVGYDFSFGFKKQGNVAFLKDWATTRGIDAVVVPPVSHEGVPVRSVSIREDLVTSRFDHAISLLGHPYLMMGTVVKGEGRGSKLGFPTANLKLSPHKLMPANGVYGGFVLYRKKRYKAMVYIGSKPTFGGDFASTAEVHILGFYGDLYGKTINVFFTHFVRGEKKFDSEFHLKSQILHDIEILS